MAKRYYLDKNAQSNGDHEVHARGCSHLPQATNSTFLGNHKNCASAVREAKKHYNQVNGCNYCCKACHTS